MVARGGNRATFVWSARQLASCCICTPAQPHTTVSFAAEELARYLRRMVGGSIPVLARTELSEYSLAIAPLSPNFSLFPCPSRTQSFTIQPGPETISVHAASPSLLLHGVYRFLEELGCVWSPHGRSFEIVPRLGAKPIALPEYHSRPRFRSVAYCSDIITWHYTEPEFLRERVTEDEELIDWMAKTGATNFFFIRHPFDTRSVIDELRPHFDARGITVEVGGHILPILLDRGCFQQHPDYFPLSRSGRRNEAGNLCVSHPQARALVAQKARALLTASPGAGALHVWGADVFGGGWCHCHACQPLSPQEQSLLVCNAIAEQLDKDGCKIPVYYLAYHDTIEPHLRIQPHPLVWCEFAPRERCYGHSIDDRTCGVNQHYHNALQAYIQLFGGQVRAFEYYGDAILFFGCLVPIPHVIAEDIAAYQDLGVAELSFLQFGQFSRWAYAANFAAFGATTRGASVSAALQGLWRQWGAEAGILNTVFGELEKIMRTLVRYGDVRLPPKRLTQRRALRHALSIHLPRLTAIATELDSHHSPSLAALGLLVRYTQTVFEGVAHEIDTGNTAEVIFRHALNILQSVDRTVKGVWGDIDLAVIHDLYKAAPLVPGWS